MTRRQALRVLAVAGGAGAARFAFAAGSAASADTAGGKVLLDNEFVRVIQHLGRPRMGTCGTALHTHPPHLTLAMTDVKARVTLPGQAPFNADNRMGDAFWDPGGPHVVENVASRDSKLYLVEPKRVPPDVAAQGDAPRETGGKVVFENEFVRVIQHLGRPRMGTCGTAVHSHPPHLTVLLTDARAKVTVPGKPSFISDGKAGDVFWDPGGAHVVENVGTRDARIYLVEIKRV
jgi:hypothetical protein